MKFSKTLTKKYYTLEKRKENGLYLARVRMHLRVSVWTPIYTRSHIQMIGQKSTLKHSRITYRARKQSTFWTFAQPVEQNTPWSSGLDFSRAAVQNAHWSSRANRLGRARHDLGRVAHQKPTKTFSSSCTHIPTSTHHQPHHTLLVHSKSHQKLQQIQLQFTTKF